MAKRMSGEEDDDQLWDEHLAECDELTAFLKSCKSRADYEALRDPRMPEEPEAFYQNWDGWRGFLGVPASSPICNKCGNHPCDCHSRSNPRERDDSWIMEHADEFKTQLIEWAKSNHGRPEHGTLLGRAFDLLTGQAD